MANKMVTSGDAKPCNKQHKKPCGDCPWRRKAIPGWLGPLTSEGWLAAAHGEVLIECHSVVGDPQPQCVGAATFRANVHKVPRNRVHLRLAQDRVRVFAGNAEFIAHHGRSALQALEED